MKIIDIDSADYRIGVDAANLMLNTGMAPDAELLLSLAEIAQHRAHQENDTKAVHRMAGVEHTLREFVEGRT